MRLAMLLIPEDLNFSGIDSTDTSALLVCG
jgi:hypothetical protein